MESLARYSTGHSTCTYQPRIEDHPVFILASKATPSQGQTAGATAHVQLRNWRLLAIIIITLTSKLEAT